MRYLTMIIILFLGISCNGVSSTSETSIDTQTPSLTSVPTVIEVTKTLAISQVVPTSALSVTTSTPSSDELLKFNGQVSRGEVFEHEISDDFVFRLEPYEHGWDIWMGDKTEPLDDYVGVATPPYKGMNARYIEGWHFRNSDNSGPNEPGPKLVQAPQKERRFYFVLNKTDHQIAYNGLNADWLFSEEEEQEQARAKRKQLEPQEGKLTITQLELGNLEVGEQAWIESMEFEVELSLPSDFE